MHSVHKTRSRHRLRRTTPCCSGYGRQPLGKAMHLVFTYCRHSSSSNHCLVAAGTTCCSVHMRCLLLARRRCLAVAAGMPWCLGGRGGTARYVQFVMTYVRPCPASSQPAHSPGQRMSPPFGTIESTIYQPSRGIFWTPKIVSISQCRSLFRGFPS